MMTEISTLAERLQIVLVETSHPGNIGAAARAMKTMGLTRLSLVRPRGYPCAEATARASGADDVLSRATLHDSLQEAIADCQFVMGTSARQRRLPWPLLEPRAAAGRLLAEATHQAQVALVFGREQSGLSNAELEFCQSAVTIPANPEYSSLNLAAAVQVLSYELLLAVGGRVESAGTGKADRKTSPASNAEISQLNAHLQQAMIRVGFMNPENPRQLPRRITRMLATAGLDHNEVQILRGFLTAVEESLGKDC